MGGCLCMGQTLCSLHTGNVVVLLFYREQGHGCAERGRVVQQGREEALWQEQNYTSLVCRESTQVTVTRSLSNPSFPVLGPQARCVPSLLGAHSLPAQQQGSRKARAASGTTCQGRQHPGVSTASYRTSEAQVRQSRGTVPCQQQQQQWSQSSSSSAWQEQMCFYGAVMPRLHDAPGCTITPVCTHSQGFHIAESGCCTVCSSSNIQDGCKVGCVLL